MRKQIINSQGLDTTPLRSGDAWINLEQVAQIEITSERPDCPIESALSFNNRLGWHADSPGAQTIRLVFDPPRDLRRILLRFFEFEADRTQEFILRWSSVSGALREIVRQQWKFTPEGSTTEIEDYKVDLNGVAVLELTIDPDLNSREAVATLADWRVA